MEELTPHQQEACQMLSPTGRRLFSLIEFDDKEQMLLEIRKSFIGLVGMILTGMTIIVIIFTVAYFLTTTLGEEVLSTTNDMRPAIYGGALVLSLFVVIGLLLSAIVFINDVIYITNEKIAQVLYKNIITRKVSQLNIGDVQDVTVKQNGIFARIFNYGTLVIETAGEQDNYIFTFVPRPTQASRTIITSHEAYVAEHGN